MLVVPVTRIAFIIATDAHPYIGGFIKFSILASMGDMLGARIQSGYWSKPRGIFYKAAVWGFIGMMITLVFTVYMGGVAAAQHAGRLPFAGVTLAQAFFGSAIMNLTFAPAMFLFHKFTDLYIDTKYDKKGGKVTLKELSGKVDWYTMIGFTMLKTIPFFWIPAHTVVFLLPGQYRVLVSAFLSIALGLLLALKRKSKTTN